MIIIKAKAIQTDSITLISRGNQGILVVTGRKPGGIGTSVPLSGLGDGDRHTIQRRIIKKIKTELTELKKIQTPVVGLSTPFC